MRHLFSHTQIALAIIMCLKSLRCCLVLLIYLKILYSAVTPGKTCSEALYIRSVKIEAKTVIS